MYAALPHVVEGWATATMCSPPSSVVGTGLCMEGIEQNPLVYDLMAELAFRWLCCLINQMTPPRCHIYEL